MIGARTLGNIITGVALKKYFVEDDEFGKLWGSGKSRDSVYSGDSENSKKGKIINIIKSNYKLEKRIY